MEKQKLPDGALDIMLKEYESLRDEIKERLKIAFSHVAYAGGIAVFALPAADKAGNLVSIPFLLAIACIGIVALIWVAFLNIRWVQHCSAYINIIEERINKHFGTEILGWETYATNVQSELNFFIPNKPPKN